MGVFPWLLVGRICSLSDASVDHMIRNREAPIGYKLSLVEFDGNGSPRAAANSTTATADIVSNPDLSQCPGKCFRPVGLAFDAQGKLYMSSDATGEIYVITKTDGSGVADMRQASSSTSGSTASNSAPSPSASHSRAVSSRRNISEGSWWLVIAAVAGAALQII